MMNKLILCFPLIFFFTPKLLFSQKGYMGKRSMITTDVLNMPMLKKFGVEYRFCLSNRTSIQLEYAKEVCKIDYSENKDPILNSASAYNTYNGLDINNVDFKKIITNYNYNTIGLSLIFGGVNHTGMPLPLGYYWGIGFTTYFGDINTKANVDLVLNDPTYNYNVQYTNGYASSVSKQNVDITCTYKALGTLYKLTYGRVWYIAKNFVVDAALDFGVKHASVIVTGRPTVEFSPNQIIPYTLFYTDPSYDKQSTRSPDTSDFSETAIYAVPKISIGYIF